METSTPNLGLPYMAYNVGEFEEIDRVLDIIDGLFGEEAIPYSAEMTAFLTATTADVTLGGGNGSITFTSKPVPGLAYKLWVIQPAAGGPFTVTWGSPITWAGGAAPVLSTVAGKKNLIRCQYINSTLGWHCEMDSNVF